MANEHDPRVRADITLEGFSGRRLKVLNVLHNNALVALRFALILEALVQQDIEHADIGP